jgi:hypothetical protein
MYCKEIKLHWDASGTCKLGNLEEFRMTSNMGLGVGVEEFVLVNVVFLSIVMMHFTSLTLFSHHV